MNAEFVSTTLPVVSSSPVLRIAAVFIMTGGSYSGYQKSRTRKNYAGEARNGLVKTSTPAGPDQNGLSGGELGLRQGGKLDQVVLCLAFEKLLQRRLNAFFGGKIDTEGINVLLILVKLEM